MVAEASGTLASLSNKLPELKPPNCDLLLSESSPNREDLAAENEIPPPKRDYGSAEVAFLNRPVVSNLGFLSLSSSF